MDEMKTVMPEVPGMISLTFDGWNSSNSLLFAAIRRASDELINVLLYSTFKCIYIQKGNDGVKVPNGNANSAFTPDELEEEATRVRVIFQILFKTFYTYSNTLTWIRRLPTRTHLVTTATTLTM